MLYSLKERLNKHSLLSDFFYSVLFGLLSLAFGELNFAIPGIEGGSSDFREVPLIIGLLYIRKPIFLIIPSIITSLTTSVGGSYITTFVMHFFAIFPFWYFYKYISSISMVVLTKGIAFSIAVLVYFAMLLVPLLIICDRLLGVNENDFFPFYIKVVGSIKFEMVATALISGLYLMQFDSRVNLMVYQRDLEEIVKNRTNELASSNKKLSSMNDELIASSEEIKLMNGNLDTLVKARSKKIEDQLELLVKYAHMNSHEVRAPLARILGLLEIIKIEKSVSQGDDIVKELCDSGIELDEVVRKMNRLLEEEIPDEKE